MIQPTFFSAALRFRARRSRAVGRPPAGKRPVPHQESYRARQPGIARLSPLRGMAGLGRQLVLAALCLLPVKGYMVIMTSPNGIIENSSLVSIDADITNNDTGATYDSLRLDSQLADLLWSSYQVPTLYGNDFQTFLSSGDIGYGIEPGSPTTNVYNGWNANFDSNGAVDIDNIGGPSDVFSSGKTMDGNFFFDKQILDADNDGLANYDLKFLTDLTTSELNDPLTIVGSVGSHNNGNFVEAYDGLFTATSGGNAYALVPTADHPAVPEPAVTGLALGVLAGGWSLLRRRGRRGESASCLSSAPACPGAGPRRRIRAIRGPLKTSGNDDLPSRAESPRF